MRLQCRWWEDRKWAGSTIWSGPRQLFPAWKHPELRWGLHPWAQLKMWSLVMLPVIPGANEQLCFCETSLHPAISQTYYKWFHNVPSPVFLTWLIKPTVWRNRCKICEVATQQGAKPLTTALLPNVCGRMNCIYSCLHVVRQMSLLNFQRWSKLNYWLFFYSLYSPNLPAW